MALREVREVALHWGRFRNVELFYQGVYHVRCRVFEEGFAGLPGPPEQVLPAAVLADEAVFCTKSVHIRYCEEQVYLNDLVLFRFEQDAGRDPPLALEVQLMYGEAPHHGLHVGTAAEAKGGDHGVARSTSQPGHQDLRFVAVSTQLLHLNSVLSGVHVFCPLTFDEQHFCCVELMAHTTLLDFRLRIRPEGALSPHAQAAPKDRPGCGCANTLVEAFMQLAGQMPTAEAASAKDAGGTCFIDSIQSSPAGASLGEAADHLQRECIARLIAAREALCTFLLELAGREKTLAAHVDALPAVRLPGHAAEGRAAAAAAQGLGPRPISSRLFFAEEPTAAVAMIAARLLAEDISSVSAQLLQAWQLLLLVALDFPEATTGLLSSAWHHWMARHWAENIFYCICPVNRGVPQEMAVVHAAQVAKLRESRKCREGFPLLIDDLEAVPPQHQEPIVLEQRCGLQEGQESVPRGLGEILGGGPNGAGTKGEPERLASCNDGLQPYAGIHVLVLVHGFQGSAFDMRLVKNNIALVYPHTLYLCSLANEDDTEGDIEKMGERLASEVRRFIQDWCSGLPPDPELGRLSFVTHSAGGIIVRSALPLLAEFHCRMHTFLSFSSPHLGYLYPPTSLFRAGLWLAKKIKKSKCLEQLSMTDSPELGSCFLSRLAELPGLEFFQHVVLVSSRQDQYVPFESARLEMPHVAEADPKQGPCYAKILRNVLEPIEAKRILRLAVDFHIPETSLDSMIGRAAHIQFIDCQHLIKMLVHTHGFLFE